jgi:small subunit ribosomal protein S29
MNMRQALTMEKRQINAGTSLVELATIGVKEPQIATVILDHFMTELGNQKTYVYVDSLFKSETL